MTTRKPAKTEPALKRALAQPRIIIDKVSPCVDQGHFLAKKAVDRPITISANVFMDGHDKSAAAVLWRESSRGRWRRKAMTPLGNDRWQAIIHPTRTGRLCFRLEAWYDQWETFRYELRKKYEAGVDVQLEVIVGQLLLQ